MSSPLLTLFLTCLTIVSNGEDCMKLCIKNRAEMEMIKCKEDKWCLLRTKGYNWREVPLGNTKMSNRKEMKENLEIPCCKHVKDPEQDMCKDYRTFERRLSGHPVIVKLDFKVDKIYNISMPEDHLTVVMWLEMRWVDPKLELCECGERVGGGDFQLRRDEEKIWLPDLHIWEARKFDRMWGLTRDENKLKVVEEEGKTVVVYEVKYRAVLACHFNTTYFPMTKNKCKVRFGSYSKDRERVVFDAQGANFGRSKLTYPTFAIEMFSLEEKDKEITRDQPRDELKMFFAYDGFQLILQEEPGTIVFQYLVTMFVLTLLGLLGIFVLSGQPSSIDRASLFAMSLLGAVLLFLEITTNTPHGYEAEATPFIKFIMAAIGLIVTCFGCYCILVRLTADGVIEGVVQDKLELVVLVMIVPTYTGWCVYFIYTKWLEAKDVGCHNMVH